MRSIFTLTLVLGLACLAIVGCTQAAPPLTPTQSIAAPTKAAPTAQPTTKAAEPTKASDATGASAKKVNYPAEGKAVSIIVPFPAGSANDTCARVLIPVLERELRVPVQVVNKPGASTQTGMTELVTQPTDGYTLGLISLPGAMLAYLDSERKAIYGRKDFVPLAFQSWDPDAIGVAADSPYKTMKDLIDAAKAKPGEIKVGTSGVMSIDHMVILMLEKAAGVKFAMVHFEGGPQQITALLGGHIDASVTTSSAFLAHTKSGNVRLLGIADKEQSKFFPNVATFESQGYKVYYGATRGLVVKTGTPNDVVDILAGVAKKATDDKDVLSKMDDLALSIRYMDQKQAAAYWDELEAETKPLIELAK